MHKEIIFKAEKHYIIYIILFIFFISWLIINILIYKIFWFNINTHITNILIFWLTIIIIYSKYIDYELNNIIIKNDTCIYINKISIIEKKEIKLNISDIKEIKYEKKWLFANMFNYWTIKINDKQIKINFINNPEKIIKDILKIIKNK